MSDLAVHRTSEGASLHARGATTVFSREEAEWLRDALIRVLDGEPRVESLGYHEYMERRSYRRAKITDIDLKELGLL